jgi:hypothetical protein
MVTIIPCTESRILFGAFNRDRIEVLIIEIDFVISKIAVIKELIDTITNLPMLWVCVKTDAEIILINFDGRVLIVATLEVVIRSIETSSTNRALAVVSILVLKVMILLNVN